VLVRIDLRGNRLELAPFEHVCQLALDRDIWLLLDR
jgi:hypothetical protein